MAGRYEGLVAGLLFMPPPLLLLSAGLAGVGFCGAFWGLGGGGGFLTSGPVQNLILSMALLRRCMPGSIAHNTKYKSSLGEVVFM